ncbi:MAG: hypothetical protein M1819_001867 [Sarea resinae]|nr:MAG: hypothetical protein M1819_001867 [Sarea resinae]
MSQKEQCAETEEPPVADNGTPSTTDTAGHQEAQGKTETKAEGGVGMDEFGLPIRPSRRPAFVQDSDEGDVRDDQNVIREGLAQPSPEPSAVSEHAEIPQTNGLQATQAAREEGVAGKEVEQPRGTARNGVEEGDHGSPAQRNNEEDNSMSEKKPTHSRGGSAAELQNDNGGKGHRRFGSSFAEFNENRQIAGASEWSHQQGVPQKEPDEIPLSDDEWQDMPAFAPYDIYDDDGKLIAREAGELDDEAAAYGGLGGAGKGYTRVQIDEDAQSATSLDEDTKYLFKEAGTNVADEDGEQRDTLAQMQATKDLLTEGQRIAYVGLTKLAMAEMIKEAEDIVSTKKTKKGLQTAAEAMKMWSQKMMLRLYAHMEISPAEQIMIEQLAEHGVQPADLTPTLMQNARVKNPMAEEPSSKTPSIASPHPEEQELKSPDSLSPSLNESPDNDPPPKYQADADVIIPDVRTPSQLPQTTNIDIDLRWTVLCDLFLVLIADSIYDSRSRQLLERVGSSLGVDWLEICRFEKRITDALEMQEAANKENWNEEQHMEKRQKMALSRKIMYMGLATVGGGLVIGLSAGLLAPVIGAGLAAGFTTIGVAGTSGFLAGTGGAALITTTGVLSGGVIAVRASHRRTGAVKTFEFRPLHNHKRVNLIVTVSGWMTGKIDDVRLPFSTVDPIMGDLYSVLWEPEMLQSTGDTINILATEALTQGLQQVLGSTILVALMASLQLPIVLTKLAYLIDNPWTVSLDRANAAGLILADSLIDRNLGVRPVTLVGFSLGSRLIFSCLRELAHRGAYGVVQNVYLFGSPIVANKDEYLRARSVVSGRFVNGYAKNDWILGYLFRATSGGIMRVAGLAPVEGIPGLENIDVTSLVPGHMAYRAAMPKLLREVGWMVESDEFTEIEDPDPENHQARQRELIAEIDEARKEIGQKPEKKRFGLFNRKKMAEKKGWETYDDSIKAGRERRSESVGELRDSLIFDVEAIRAELASEQIEVRQLESTLPPMRLDLSGTNSAEEKAIRPALGESKSYLSGRSSRSPSLPPPPNRNTISTPDQRTNRKYFEYYSHEPELAEEEVQMTFDTPFSSNSAPPPRRSSVDDPVSHQAARDVGSLPPPELRHSVTMPAVSGLGLEHNAWAEEDEEFGKEQEVQMIFE